MPTATVATFSTSLVIDMLLGAFAEKAATTLADKSVSGCLDWIAAHFRGSATPPGDAEIDRIRHLLAAERSSAFDKLLAQLRFTDRRGVFFVGPSGAGKSALIHALTKGYPPRTTSSTSSYRRTATRFGSLVSTVHDTAGGEHDLFKSEVASRIQSEHPRILTIVAANGYLHTANTPPLSRPGLPPVRTLAAHRTRCLREETRYIEWLSQLPPPRTKISYFLVVLNKVEQWDSSIDRTIIRYKNGPFGQAVASLASKWGKAAQRVEYVHTSAIYDTFPGNTRGPGTQIGVAGSDLSIRLLRALIISWLGESR